MNARTATPKHLEQVHEQAQRHWVGNGFPVATLFSPHTHGGVIDPFLLLDYTAPHGFGPSEQRRGVGEHPHRGFETVSIVLQGEIEHRDSTGAGGTIGAGDVQWMTAGAGLVHEEFHSQRFSRSGGMLQAVQLWVNLPARHKMAPPRYQSILAADIPSVALPGEVGHVRVIAGHLDGHAGPARTFSPMDVWEVRLTAGASVTLPVVPGRRVLLVVLSGAVMVGGDSTVDPAQLAVLGPEGDVVSLEARGASSLLLLSGEPLEEPVAAYGPFVMNTEEEIRQAFADFQAGRFGQLSTTQG